MEKIVTRFAPSPTGLLHAGNYRTAIFAYLFAKKMGGTFIVRIEDTDRQRSKKEYEEDILSALGWLGLSYDSFYRQSEHVKRHEELLRKLVAEDKAYLSREEPKEEGQRSEVVRFRNPNTTVTFVDVVRGPITFDTTELRDFVIGKSLTEPLYHFGVVVDDMDEGVTHVVRGDDHISNTPRQILIQRALGASTPVYAHLPLVLGADRAKLSKRRGAKALTAYRDEGYSPEALINYLALLGWHPEGEREIFTPNELVQEFNLARIQKSAGIFDEAKLRWFNHEHLKRLALKTYESLLLDFMARIKKTAPAYLPRAARLLQERAETLLDAARLIEAGEFSFFENTISYEPALLLSGAKTDAETAKKHLAAVSTMLAELPGADWTAERIKEAIFPYATAEGRGAVLWPMRVALSGQKKSPDPFTLAALIGHEKTLERIARAIPLL